MTIWRPYKELTDVSLMEQYYKEKDAKGLIFWIGLAGFMIHGLYTYARIGFWFFLIVAGFYLILTMILHEKDKETSLKQEITYRKYRSGKIKDESEY